MTNFRKSLTFVILIFCKCYCGVLSESTPNATQSTPEESTGIISSSVTVTRSTSNNFSTVPTETPPDVQITTKTTTTTDASTILQSEESKTTSVQESNDLSKTSSTIPTTIKIAAKESLRDSSTSTFAPSESTKSSTLTISSTSSGAPALSKSGFPHRPSLFRCPKLFLDEYAVSGSGENGTCVEPEDCKQDKFHKRKDILTKCVQNEDQTDSGCCYMSTKNLCSQGSVGVKLVECETLDDCNLDDEQSQRWCDPVSKFCCQLDNKKELFCPVRRIPLMGETKCTHDKGNNTWVCPNSVGFCVEQHCCPPGNQNMMPGKKPYETNIDCTDSTVISKTLLFGYCDPLTKKIFIMSEKNYEGQDNKMLDAFCMSGRDCGRSYGTENVCVRTSTQTPRCFINPRSKYHSPETRSLFWVSTVSYVTLGTSVLALLFTILHRIYTIDDSFPGERSVSEEQSQPLVLSAQ
ncbi:hypothetical protein L5515_007455 [Caenorhabditis briggsae]|uniref:Domain of unknown function DX domain-containing protein n=1 Tax=Caenorhabditis briggsae TaxID=6238 RepID=A0AAE9F4M5_CAEBR|nr:hypothetical protein L5515_007455 [Caenorhabditis briggsae]